MKKQLFAATLALAFAGSASAQLPTDALSGLGGANGITGVLTQILPVGVISDGSRSFVTALPITTFFTTLSTVGTSIPLTALNGSGLPLLSDPAPGQDQLSGLLGGLPLVGGLSGAVRGFTVDGLSITGVNLLGGLNGFVVSPDFVGDLVPGGLLDVGATIEALLTGVLLGPVGGGGLPDFGSLTSAGLPVGALDVTTLTGLLSGVPLSGL